MRLNALGIHGFFFLSLFFVLIQNFREENKNLRKAYIDKVGDLMRARMLFECIVVWQWLQVDEVKKCLWKYNKKCFISDNLSRIFVWWKSSLMQSCFRLNSSAISSNINSQDIINKQSPQLSHHVWFIHQGLVWSVQIPWTSSTLHICVQFQHAPPLFLYGLFEL